MTCLLYSYVAGCWGFYDLFTVCLCSRRRSCCVTLPASTRWTAAQSGRSNLRNSSSERITEECTIVGRICNFKLRQVHVDSILLYYKGSRRGTLVEIYFIFIQTFIWFLLSPLKPAKRFLHRSKQLSPKGPPLVCRARIRTQGSLLQPGSTVCWPPPPPTCFL